MMDESKEDSIILGDCLEELVKIKEKSVDLIITDPPYFLPINSYVGTSLSQINGLTCLQ